MLAFANSPETGTLLDHSYELAGMLFDDAPMGIAIVSPDFQLLHCNPRWASLVARYTHTAMSDIRPGASFLSLVPGIEVDAVPLFAELASGSPVQREGLRLESGGITSYWDVVLNPLMDRGKVVAVVIMTTDATDRVLAYQRLEERVAERTHELERRREVAESLSDTLSVLNSNRPLDEILQYLIAQVRRLLSADGAMIFGLEPELNLLRVRATDGITDRQIISLALPVGEGAVGKAVLTRMPVVIANVDAVVQTLMADHTSEEEAKWRETLLRLADHYCAALSMPLIIRDEIYGGISLYYSRQREFTREDVDLATMFAHQAAQAIDNAQLRQSAERSAAAAERSRLARDLHDSVTQTLFAASLIAEVLPRLWEIQPQEGKKRLEEMRRLTKGALAEMRTLLLELRPASLTEVSLRELLRQLIEAVLGRSAGGDDNLQIDLNVEGQPKGRLPHDVQIAFYRIAQEALNNVGRHSHAAHAQVSLRIGPRSVALRISDDGRGFNPGAISAEHLGLSIMRERASGIGARLDIKSRPGRGTRVSVTWTVNKAITRPEMEK